MHHQGLKIWELKLFIGLPLDLKQKSFVKENNTIQEYNCLNIKKTGCRWNEQKLFLSKTDAKINENQIVARQITVWNRTIEKKEKGKKVKFYLC